MYFFILLETAFHWIKKVYLQKFCTFRKFLEKPFVALAIFFYLKPRILLPIWGRRLFFQFFTSRPLLYNIHLKMFSSLNFSYSVIITTLFILWPPSRRIFFTCFQITVYIYTPHASLIYTKQTNWDSQNTELNITLA